MGLHTLEMLLLQKSSIFINSSSYLPLVRRRNDGGKFVTKMSKRKDQTDSVQSSTRQQQPFLRVSNTVLVRSVVAVFGLGFIDAGYSGDWSRIGVISKEVEDILKIAAFIVIPSCILLIFSLSKKPADCS